MSDELSNDAQMIRDAKHVRDDASRTDAERGLARLALTVAAERDRLQAEQTESDETIQCLMRERNELWVKVESVRQATVEALSDCITHRDALWRIFSIILEKPNDVSTESRGSAIADSERGNALAQAEAAASRDHTLEQIAAVLVPYIDGTHGKPSAEVVRLVNELQPLIGTEQSAEADGERIHLGPGDGIELPDQPIIAKEAMTVRVIRAEGEHAFGDCAGSDCTGPHTESEQSKPACSHAEILRKLEDAMGCNAPGEHRECTSAAEALMRVLSENGLMLLAAHSNDNDGIAEPAEPEPACSCAAQFTIEHRPWCKSLAEPAPEARCTFPGCGLPKKVMKGTPNERARHKRCDYRACENGHIPHIGCHPFQPQEEPYHAK